MGKEGIWQERGAQTNGMIKLLQRRLAYIQYSENVHSSYSKSAIWITEHTEWAKKLHTVFIAITLCTLNQFS